MSTDNLFGPASACCSPCYVLRNALLFDSKSCYPLQLQSRLQFDKSDCFTMKYNKYLLMSPVCPLTGSKYSEK